MSPEKRKIVGEVLKDQALTNLEIIYDEFLDKEYCYTKEEPKTLQKSKTSQKQCLHCIHWISGSCEFFPSDKYDECMKNLQKKYYEERKYE